MLHAPIVVQVCLAALAWSASRAEAASDKWDENVRPKLTLDFFEPEARMNETVHRFHGNNTHTDFFKLLRKDGGSLLIGARNIIYNLSLPNLKENVANRISWHPEPEDRELCLLKGKLEDDCQNYIRVLVRLQDELLVCGTNAYNPLCRHYEVTHPRVAREFSGRGFCPYDPRHNSTSIYADGELYAGTVADFSATDALVIKNGLRTEQYDLKHLNEPHFVSSLEDEDHVYFVFRESALEFMNCGKAVYSRVARVCKSDRGGPRKFRDKWTTFLKTRLNCSVPGDRPFYFDEVQATSDLVDGHLFYGVFTTPDNSISGSAICAFSLQDIAQSLNDGPFKGQASLNANWLPVADPPRPRPGLCGSQSTEEGLNFIKRNVLMDEAVASAHRRPLYIKTSLGERLTVIAVDPRVQSRHDVLFAGTTRGRVLKLINASTASSREASPVVIESLQVFGRDVAVRNVLVARESGQVIVVSEREVAAVALQRCHLAASCHACVALQDPYCAWDTARHACHAFASDSREQLHNVHAGFDARCPPETPAEATTSKTTTAVTEAEEAATTTLPAFQCPNCSCHCPNSPSEDVALLDLLDVYNQTDLALGVFQDAPFDEVRNSLVPVKRQEKELSIFYEEPDFAVEVGEIEASANAGPSHPGFPEETLTLAIVLTAFAALLVGFFLGIFVTRLCSGQADSGSKQRQLASPDGRKYSVTTTISSTEKSSDFEQVARSHEPVSLPLHQSHQLSHGGHEPRSLNPSFLENQRPERKSASLPQSPASSDATTPQGRSTSRCASLQHKVKRIYL